MPTDCDNTWLDSSESLLTEFVSTMGKDARWTEGQCYSEHKRCTGFSTQTGINKNNILKQLVSDLQLAINSCLSQYETTSSVFLNINWAIQYYRDHARDTVHFSTAHATRAEIYPYTMHIPLYGMIQPRRLWLFKHTVCFEGDQDHSKALWAMILALQEVGRDLDMDRNSGADLHPLNFGFHMAWR